MIFFMLILGVVKKNPLFLHEIEWKNNGFLFTTPNIYAAMQVCVEWPLRLLLRQPLRLKNLL